MEPVPFTVEFNGIVDVIRTEIYVGHSKKLVQGESRPISLPYQAIWDTGANGTLISSNIVKTLGLVQVGVIKGRTIGIDGKPEERLIPAFMVNFYFNKFIIQGWKVGQGNVAKGDVLIGMDIIRLGDFAITNHNGKTCMSFRCPSGGKIDFREQIGK